MKKFTILFFVLLIATLSQVNAQVIFADYETVDMEFGGWNGTEWAKTTNDYSDAVNSSANVGQFTHANNNWWSGIAGTIALASNIDFSVTPFIRMKVYAEKACNVMMKIENATDGSKATELMYKLKDDEINKWVEITYNFSEVTETELNKFVLFFDPDQSAGSDATTKYYFDDIIGSDVPPAGQFAFSPENGATEVKTQDPLSLTSNLKLRMIDDSPITDPTSVLIFKKTDANGEDVPFTGFISTDGYTLTIVPDVFLDESTVYYYGIKDNTIEYAIGETPVTGVSASFTSTADGFPMVYTINDFDGTSKTRVVETLGDPAPSFAVMTETDAGIGSEDNSVLQFNKTGTWGGWERIHMELNYPIEVVDGEAAFSLRAYFPKETYVRFKLSNQKDDGGIFKETDADVTVVNGWQTLYFEFTGLEEADYSHLLIFPAGGDGAELTYYIDDVKGPNIPTPEVKVDYSPLDGATNGWAFSKMSITSNYLMKNLDGSVVTDLSGKVELRKDNASGTPVAFTAAMSADNKVITITPDADLEEGSTYWYGVVDNTLKFEDNDENLVGIAASFTVRAPEMEMYCNFNEFTGGVDHVSVLKAQPDGYGANASAVQAMVNYDPTFTREVLEWSRGTDNWGWEFVQFKLEDLVDVSGDKIVSMDVYSPKSTYVRLKISNDDESVFHEVDADIMQSDTWETLFFDLTDVDLSDADYNTLTFFIDGGNGDDPQTYYIDDLKGPFVKSATGIFNAKVETLTVSPNPATNVIRVAGVNSADVVEVYNTVGEKVKEMPAGDGTISIADLSSGIYIVKVNEATAKIIKK
ncbi:T9SS type A sorting domain-containing protein [Labilibacter sediminis]|nr:T9SS type A sorting domain-containing protein [Labilibacter sediminis]